MKGKLSLESIQGNGTGYSYFNSRSHIVQAIIECNCFEEWILPAKILTQVI